MEFEALGLGFFQWRTATYWKWNFEKKLEFGKRELHPRFKTLVLISPRSNEKNKKSTTKIRELLSLFKV